jgi:replicative DNA helicase
VIQGGTRERFADCLAAAVQFDLPSIHSFGQALDRLEQELAIRSWDEAEDMTPWPSLNRRLGRWRGGNLIVLSGPQGTGKTTWTLNVAASWAARGLPALVYCLEMTVEELVQHVLCAHFHLPEGGITAPVIEKARHELADWPLYLGANPRVTGRKDVMDLLGQAVRRYGLRLAVFDNLHVLSRSIEHRTEEVGVLSKNFKQLAMEYEIPLVLVAQPRKLTPGTVMTPWDLKDSVDIFSDADQVILLHRELVAASTDTAAVDAAGSAASSAAGDQHAEDDGSADNLSPMTLVRLAKGRHMPSRDALLYFEGAQHRFREVTETDRQRMKPERQAGGRRPERRRRDLE